MGYEPPTEEKLPVDILYVSQHLRPVPGSMGREKVVIIGHAPWRLTGAEYLEQEDGRWILTLIGCCGHHPPTDQRGYLEFAEPIVPPHVFASIGTPNRSATSSRTGSRRACGGGTSGCPGSRRG